MSHKRTSAIADRAALLVLTALVVVPATARAQYCPSSLVHVQNYAATPTLAIAATAWDSVIVDTWTTHVQFDRAARTCALQAASGGRASSDLRLIDLLDVLGAPSGTPVPATLVLSLAGHTEQACGGSGCGVTFEVTLAAGADSASANANQSGPSYNSKPLNTTLTLPVVLVAGSPLEVQVHVRYGTGPGQDSALGEVTGKYDVTGLPGGLTTAWCADGSPVPALRASWGKLKSRYR